MDFGELAIYDFSGYRFYYGVSETSHLLVETQNEIIDLIDMKQYPVTKFQAFLRLTSPLTNYIHDNIEVRLDREKITSIIDKYPAYATALQHQLTKMTILSTNIRFHLDDFLIKIEEIISDYSQTNYHTTEDQRKNFVRHITSNFGRYIQLEEFPLTWINFFDCLAQMKNEKEIVVVNNWRSFFVIYNTAKSSYKSLYYPYSTILLKKFTTDPLVELINLDESNLDQILDPAHFRIDSGMIKTPNPIKYL